MERKGTVQMNASSRRKLTSQSMALELHSAQRMRMSHPGWIDPPWIQGVDASAKECVGDLTMTGKAQRNKKMTVTRVKSAMTVDLIKLLVCPRNRHHTGSLAV